MRQEKSNIKDYKEREIVTGQSKEQIHAFKNGNQLVVNAGNENEFVQVINSAGEIQITIEMTENGAEIKLTGNTIKIDAKEKFVVESPIVELKAKQQLKLSSDGDMHQEIKRDSFSTARIQNITADLGNVNIKANDDVRLDGERVKLNCAE